MCRRLSVNVSKLNVIVFFINFISEVYIDQCKIQVIFGCLLFRGISAPGDYCLNN